MSRHNKDSNEIWEEKGIVNDCAKINGARKWESCAKINGAKIWVSENWWCAKFKVSKVSQKFSKFNLKVGISVYGTKTFYQRNPEYYYTKMPYWLVLCYKLPPPAQSPVRLIVWKMLTLQTLTLAITFWFLLIFFAIQLQCAQCSNDTQEY